MPSSAYLLVCHGSRDVRLPMAVDALKMAFGQRICHTQSFQTAPLLSVVSRDPLRSREFLSAEPANQTPTPFASIAVEVAYLECVDQPLHQQLLQFVQTIPTHNHLPQRLTVVPLFLSPGVHVMEDIPGQVALAKPLLPSPWSMTIAPYLGSSPRIRRVLTEQIAPLPLEAWILMAHGSQRSGGNQPIVALAEYLGALPAYWSIAPDLTSQVTALYQLGLRKIGILPYILFPGSMIDAIQQRIPQWQQSYPDLTVYCAPPLHQNPAMADLLVEVALSV